jgi:hypothetical protein
MSATAVIEQIKIFKNRRAYLVPGSLLNLVNEFELGLAKKLSAIALSQQSPRRLVLPRSPCLASSCW